MSVVRHRVETFATTHRPCRAPRSTSSSAAPPPTLPRVLRRVAQSWDDHVCPHVTVDDHIICGNGSRVFAGAPLPRSTARGTVDDILVNTGLGVPAELCWRGILDSGDVVEGVDLHPAVETVARILRADPDAAISLPWRGLPA